MNKQNRILMNLTTFVFVSILISGCFAFSNREFNSSKSDYANISFQYPRNWKLQKEFDYKITTHEGWILEIPGLHSDITIGIREMADSQEADEWFENKITTYFDNLDTNMKNQEEIEVCGMSYQIYKYYQPEGIEDDFIINESNKLTLPFTNENIYYSFSATVLISEQSSYAEIEEAFLSIIDSITCE